MPVYITFLVSVMLHYEDFVPEYWGPVHCMSPAAKILEEVTSGTHEVHAYGSFSVTIINSI